jgi:hypothetical protein
MAFSESTPLHYLVDKFFMDDFGQTTEDSSVKSINSLLSGTESESDELIEEGEGISCNFEVIAQL